MERASGKLAVHDQLLQHRLPMLSEARHRTVKILGRPASGVEMHKVPGGTGTDQGPGCQIGRIKNIDISEAVSLLRNLQHGCQNVLRPGQGDLCVSCRDVRLLKRVLQAQCIKQVLIFRLLKGIDRKFSLTDPQFADHGFFRLYRSAARQDGHTGRIQIVHGGLIGILCDKHHRHFSGRDAFAPQGDALFVDAVDQREIAVTGQHKAQIAQQSGADGVHCGTGHGIERHQVHCPENDQAGPGGNRGRILDGLQVIDTDEHTDDGHRGTDGRQNKVILKCFRVSDPIDEKASHHTDRHKHRAQPARNGRLEHQAENQGQEHQRR